MALFFGHMPWKETTVTKWRCFSDSIACEVASDKSAVTKWRCFLLGSPPNKQSNLRKSKVEGGLCVVGVVYS